MHRLRGEKLETLKIAYNEFTMWENLVGNDLAMVRAASSFTRIQNLDFLLQNKDKKIAMWQYPANGK
ncbi:hypothetical protein [Planobacterium oryzisoli]|uniref:Uncharacterized protein n=1 Tax=Planobacterium oryzisoli TaxID=2771435 RepID=A0A931E5E8_9FLAO|nr:hypothetical protein [Planobacterium oryzisoli]MBF5026990.1 hypothetical protein [Planobacterium oryzisoli]